MSIRSAFMLYVLVAAVAATAACALVINLCDAPRVELRYKYWELAQTHTIPSGGHYSVSYGEDGEVRYTIYDAAGRAADSFSVDYSSQEVELFYDPELAEPALDGYTGSNVISVTPQYSTADLVLDRALGVAGALAIPVVYLAALVLCASAFYRRKLKRPIETLDAASARIAENDLDFAVEAESGNELGRLCASFEKMRGALAETSREMWRQMEERRRLNAAFSHDLRTPLTVLKGHAAMLAEALPAGTVSPQEAAEEVRVMQSHVARLENYVDAMGRLQRLEDADVARREVPLRELAQALRDSAEIVCAGRAVSLSVNGAAETARVDPALVMQVCDNLLSNAARYAREAVSLSLFAGPRFLAVSVEDDGGGFSAEALEKAAAPFYKGRESGAGHLGLGLHICEILTRRHGGGLYLANGMRGARVTARFAVD